MEISGGTALNDQGGLPSLLNCFFRQLLATSHKGASPCPFTCIRLRRAVGQRPPRLGQPLPRKRRLVQHAQRQLVRHRSACNEKGGGGTATVMAQQGAGTEQVCQQRTVCPAMLC